MKTVQESLRKVDEDELIRTYLYNYSENIKPYEKWSIDNLTVAEYKEFIINQLKDYLHRLKTLPIKKNDDEKTWIFFEERCFKDGFPDFQSSLINDADLREKGADAPSYAYEFTDQEEVLGYYVADNLHTQNNLEDLLSDIMFEMNFFGFEQEDLTKEKTELDRRVSEVKSGEGKFVSVDDLFKDMEEENPYTDKEKELENKVIEASTKYITYSRKLEIEQILKDLGKK